MRSFTRGIRVAKVRGSRRLDQRVDEVGKTLPSLHNPKTSALSRASASEDVLTWAQRS